MTPTQQQLAVVAQASQIRAQVSALLAGGYAVELDNRFRYFPVDVYPSGLRSQIREDINLLGARVDEAWQPSAPVSVTWPDRDPDSAGVIAEELRRRRAARQRGVSDVRRAGGGRDPRSSPPVQVRPGSAQGGTGSDRPGVSDAAPAPPPATSSASGGCGTAAIPAAAPAGVHTTPAEHPDRR